MSELKTFAFVLMPFDSQFQDIYKFGIKETANNSDIIAERVDEQHYTEQILERIYRQIESSDFIIAEMTGRNPNVFYEVGYAHAKSKLCILIAQKPDDIPFDLKHHPHIIYDGTIGDLKSKILPKLEWMKEETRRRKIKTITLSVKCEDADLEKTKYRHTGSFNLIANLKNFSEIRSPEIEAIYLKTKNFWTLTVSNIECPSNPVEKKDSLRHFIAPPIKRLSPGAFAQVKIGFKKQFWSHFTGQEPSEIYSSKGNLEFEIATSEGTFFENHAIDVKFEEFPF